MKNIVLLLIPLFIVLKGNAQIVLQETEANPIVWNYEVKKLNKKHEYVLVFSTEIKKGWHLFSQNPGDSSLIGPSFTFDKNASVKFAGAVTEAGTLIETIFEGFDNKIRYFEDHVEFTQKIIYKGKKAITITGEHRFQLCNDHMCLPPVTKKFEFVIPKQ